MMLSDRDISIFIFLRERGRNDLLRGGVAFACCSHFQWLLRSQHTGYLSLDRFEDTRILLFLRERLILALVGKGIELYPLCASNPIYVHSESF